MQNRRYWYLAALLVANLTLLLPNGHWLRVAGALLLITVWPGVGWSTRLIGSDAPLLRVLLAAALGYTLTGLAALLLHYLPGPVHAWQLLLALNGLAILPLFTMKQKIRQADFHWPRLAAIGAHLPLLLILGVAIFLRVANLPYSEFQGDEALAMISAAEALEGHEDALFLRAKGPGEVLLPMALWRLTGVITEATARLPFTLASLLAIVTIYLLGQQLSGGRVAWLAAGFFALNGFMVAFGRIVQYQALVVWFSALAFLMALHWQQTRRQRFAILSGLFLGVGLLAHYDAILVAPALLWLLIFSGRGPALKAAALLAASALLAALPFYLPYALDPQANRTGEYVGQRIGDELRNNLPDFFHFTTFYSSSYYLIISGLLVFGLLIAWIWRARWSRWPLPALLVAAALAVSLKPDLLNFEPTLNLAALPFALIFLGAFLALPFGSARQAPVMWLAAPFLGYNFIVALGLTHIYTTAPAWSLLAAISMNNCQLIMNKKWRAPRLAYRVLLIILLVLPTLFLWNAFVRHDVEYWQDYPNGNLSIFWTPYPEPPKAGFFGFAHRAGWKAVGQQIAAGQLSGDYGSNEEPDVTTWYTRGAPRACDPRPEYYFLADDLIDPVPVPAEVLNSSYRQIGGVVLPNQKQLRIMQQTPVTQQPGQLDELQLSRAFDASATPAAFARSARGSLPAQANFANLIQLVGYNLDTRRAYAGGRVPVTLYWQAIAPIPASYQVFTHLAGETGPVAQADGVPVCWSYPTDVWRPGQIIADQHAIIISPDTPPGQYPLEIGLYLPDTFERLDVLDVAGNPAGASITLEEVLIERR